MSELKSSEVVIDFGVPKKVKELHQEMSSRWRTTFFRVKSLFQVTSFICFLYIL